MAGVFVSNRLKLIAGIIPSIVAYVLYAYGRFGTVYDSAFARFYQIDLNGAGAHPGHGPFSLHYFSMNFWTIMFAPPMWQSNFPFFHPHLYGQALWTISPAFIIAVAAPWSKLKTWLLWAAVLVVMTPSMLVFTNGQEQFGFRYAIMAYPFLLALMAKGWVGSQLDKVLVVASIILTSAGVYELRFA